MTISSVSDNGEGWLYVLYESGGLSHIGCLELGKLVMNDYVEDTIEVFALVMK